MFKFYYCIPTVFVLTLGARAMVTRTSPQLYKSIVYKFRDRLQIPDKLELCVKLPKIKIVAPIFL